jgi:hypothetical protein
LEDEVSLAPVADLNPAREENVSESLAATLLAIQERRGHLFMLDVSRHLLEGWDLGSDNLRMQDAKIRLFVSRLLRE